MASESTLSSLAQLAAVRLDVCSCQQDEGTAAEILHPHAVQSRRRGRHHPIVLDVRDPAGCRSSRLVEEEVLRRDAEGKRLVFVLNKIGA